VLFSVAECMGNCGSSRGRLLKKVSFESFDTSVEAGTRPQTEWDGDYVQARGLCD